jgi:hypothetical protein
MPPRQQMVVTSLWYDIFESCQVVNKSFEPHVSTSLGQLRDRRRRRRDAHPPTQSKPAGLPAHVPSLPRLFCSPKGSQTPIVSVMRSSCVGLWGPTQSCDAYFAVSALACASKMGMPSDSSRAASALTLSAAARKRKRGTGAVVDALRGGAETAAAAATAVRTCRGRRQELPQHDEDIPQAQRRLPLLPEEVHARLSRLKIDLGVPHAGRKHDLGSRMRRMRGGGGWGGRGVIEGPRTDAHARSGAALLLARPEGSSRGREFRP